MWKYTKDGEFSTNSAYHSIKANSVMENNFKGAWIWKLDTLPKIISYFWLCMHNSAPIREILAGRGIKCSPICLICKNQSESLDHLLRDCVFARQFWEKIRTPHVIPPLHTQSLGDWLHVNCHSKVPWSVIFPFAIWNLWTHQNRVVFDNAPLNINLHGLCLSQVVEFFYSAGKMRKINQRVLMQVKWSKPPEGWYKLNSDGTSSGNPRRAGGGV